MIGKVLRGSHSPGGDPGAPGRRPAPDLERLLPGPGSLSGGGTSVPAAVYCSGGSHRVAAAHPGGDGTGRPAWLGRASAGDAAPGGVHRSRWSRLGAGVLHPAAVLVRERFSTVNPGEITGYAVGLWGHTARDGGVVWYGGGKLAADLTLPKLRARWTGSASGGDPFGGAGVPATVVRGALRTRVTQAAEQAADEAGFFGALREAGMLVRLRFSETDPGQVTGYSVTLPGHIEPDGTPLWYGGGRLAAGLTLPRLRERWKRGIRGSAERSGTPRFTAPERDEIYQHAARQARTAAEHIRRCVQDRSGRSGRRRLGCRGHAAPRGTGAAQPVPAVCGRFLRPSRPCRLRAHPKAQP